MVQMKSDVRAVHDFHYPVISMCRTVIRFICYNSALMLSASNKQKKKDV